MQTSLEKTLSYVSVKEQEECKEVIRETLGFDPPRVSGYNLCVMLYTPSEEILLKDKDGREILDPTGQKTKLIIPQQTIENAKYSSCVALVCAIGDLAYKARKFEGSGPWCRVGDWVVIPRHEGSQIMYRDVPMMIIPDDCILAVVEQPEYVKRS